MKLILHVGMGKTGTTSVQKALKRNLKSLEQNGIEYLGMDFPVLEPEFLGLGGIVKLASQQPSDQVQFARANFDWLRRRSNETGATTFVVSDEEILGQAPRVFPFVKTLSNQVDLKIISYIRSPYEWLPSAYAQWGVRHKVYKGPIQPFEEMADRLLPIYERFGQWSDEFGDRYSVKLFDKNSNVVNDFSELLGIQLAHSEDRALERPSDVELVLRALFNNRFQEPVLPNRFDAAVKLRTKHASGVSSITRMKSIVDNDTIFTAEIAKRTVLFQSLEQRFNIEFPKLEANSEPPRKNTSDEPFRDRLIDSLVDIVLEQSIRIQAIEEELNRAST